MLGVVSALAFPPLYAAPALFVAYPLLLWQLNGAESHRKACLIGWAFGFGQFAVGFYWTSVSMFTDIAHWWWAVPFSSTLLPILLGFIPGFACMMWWRLRLAGVRRVFAFAAWLTVGEWIRGHFLTGFPWNLTAHTWIAWLPVLQSYSFLGAYALGYLTIVAACLPSLFGAADYSFRRALAWTAGGLGVLAALALWGALRVPSSAVATTPGITIRMVQPNISQGEKWTQALSQAHFDTLLRLSKQPAAGALPNVFVWPETAVPYPFDAYPEVPKVIGSILPPDGVVLTGVVRADGHGADAHYYNSLEAVDAAGNRLGHYDKAHLAPFGEYMPFRSVLHLDALAVGAVDLTPGKGPRTLRVKNLPPFSPLICYEAIFPERVVQAGTRPGWLLQITNDGWFGTSSGPYQHFAMARARAVEQGLPLMRVGNTGITGAVDPYGRVLGELPLAAQGILDVSLPQALAAEPFYARFGDSVFAVLILVTAFASRRN